jgi:hypothetical protein
MQGTIERQEYKCQVSAAVSQPNDNNNIKIPRVADPVIGDTA